MNRKSNATEKPTGQWWKAMPLLLIASWMTLSSVGCSTRLVVLPADKTVVRLPAGQAYTPQINGYFVPDARMQEILKK